MILIHVEWPRFAWTPEWHNFHAFTYRYKTLFFPLDKHPYRINSSTIVCHFCNWFFKQIKFIDLFYFKTMLKFIEKSDKIYWIGCIEWKAVAYRCMTKQMPDIHSNCQCRQSICIVFVIVKTNGRKSSSMNACTNV